MSPRILLTTLNAKYIHSGFGLRYLAANMGDLSGQTQLAEFDINQRPLDIAEQILARSPAIVGMGVYVWNARPCLEVARVLKRIAPAIRLILGGPEVSHEPEQQEICALADHVTAGEGDLVFAETCRAIFAGTPPPHFIQAEQPDLASLRLPYSLYLDDDLAHRLLYVEASRGCPFGCEFCLSSLETAVRAFPLEPFLAEMEALIRRGARQFKFVDRTFNLHLPTALAILDFFRQHLGPGLFLHFEIVPDRVPEPLREALAAFPPGTVQLEAGIQTFNPEVAARIHRLQDYPRLEENLRWLRGHTHAYLHADLIAGLPGESYESFAAGFDRLLALTPHEIQVGILKRLRGAPITRHTAEWGMIYSDTAPYELLANRDLDFPAMQRIRRFASYWDHVANSGNFTGTVRRLWAALGTSPFHAFMAFTDWAYQRLRRTDSIALDTWARTLADYLSGPAGQPRTEVVASIQEDFANAGRAPWNSEPAARQANLARNSHNQRQRRREEAASSQSPGRS